MNSVQGHRSFNLFPPHPVLLRGDPLIGASARWQMSAFSVAHASGVALPSEQKHPRGDLECLQGRLTIRLVLAVFLDFVPSRCDAQRFRCWRETRMEKAQLRCQESRVGLGAMLLRDISAADRPGLPTGLGVLPAVRPSAHRPCSRVSRWPARGNHTPTRDAPRDRPSPRAGQTPSRIGSRESGRQGLLLHRSELPTKAPRSQAWSGSFHDS
jgi:hypothetical protein